MDELCNKDDGSKGGHVISSKRTQEILQAFGLQLANDPADSKASVQQGHEIRQRIHEFFLSSLHLLRGPRFHDISNATLDPIPYIFHRCGNPVCRLSSRRACERCVRPHRPLRLTRHSQVGSWTSKATTSFLNSIPSNSHETTSIR